MAVWHWLLGIGLTAIVAIVTQYRALPSTNSYSRKNEQFVDPDNICPICFEVMESRDMNYLPCMHALHDHCLTRLKTHSKKCPKCRAPF
uniref:RING-type domain-containing protein n=1 Tax=Musca domestica TaxID=7370 RepID=A0A1I8MYF8_MUSDO